MESFLAQCINGLATGCIYALIVLGMNLLVLVRGVVFFSYAHVVAMSMATGWVVIQYTQSLILGIPAIFLTAPILITLSEPLFRPLAKRKAFLETVVLALGIGIIITEVLSHFINQGAPIAFPSGLTGGGAMFRHGMIAFSMADIYTLIGCVVAVFTLLLFLYRHKQGRAIRAMAQDRSVATFLGIPFKKTGIYGFAIAGLLAGIAALLMTINLGSTSSEMGETVAIKAMILMLFAGMGNLKGGLISALVMGLAEAMALAYLPGRWTEAIFFGIIMVVIIFKPKGLFGTQT